MGHKDIGILKSEFVAKTHFLSIIFSFLMNLFTCISLDWGSNLLWESWRERYYSSHQFFIIDSIVETIILFLLLHIIGAPKQSCLRFSSLNNLWNIFLRQPITDYWPQSKICDRFISLFSFVSFSFWYHHNKQAKLEISKVYTIRWQDNETSKVYTIRWQDKEISKVYTIRWQDKGIQNFF